MVSCLDASPFAFVEALADMLKYEAVICNYPGEENGNASFRSVEWNRSAEKEQLRPS
jgi:hypothetical protein